MCVRCVSAENGLLSGALPLVVAGHTVGLVRAELLPLVRAAAVFRVSEREVTMDPALETADARSEAMAELLQRWRAEHDLVALRGWRDEVHSTGRCPQALDCMLATTGGRSRAAKVGSRPCRYHEVLSV